MNMKVRIDVDTMTFVRFWLVVIGFGLAGVMIYSARTALLIIGIAFFLALALNKPVAWLARMLPNRSRLGGTALAFTSVVLIIGAIVWFVMPPLIQQTAKFAQTLPSLIDQANSQWVGLNEFVENNDLRPQVESVVESVKDQSAALASRLGSDIIGGIGSFAAFLIGLVLVLVITFLMLLEGPSWMKRIWGLYRDKEKMHRHKDVATKMYNVVTGYVNGQLTVSAIGALVAGSFAFTLSLIFSDVPANLAMPTILLTFILTLIPMFGSTLAGITVGLLILFNNVTAAIIYGIFFIAYQQIENNVIQPAIQAKRVELSALAVLVSVTIGTYVSGLIGGIIAVPIAGSLKVLLEEHLERSEPHRTKNDKPAGKLIQKLRQVGKTKPDKSEEVA